jgi:hypothetical protein
MMEMHARSMLAILRLDAPMRDRTVMMAILAPTTAVTSRDNASMSPPTATTVTLARLTRALRTTAARTLRIPCVPMAEAQVQPVALAQQVQPVALERQVQPVALERQVQPVALERQVTREQAAPQDKLAREAPLEVLVLRVPPVRPATVERVEAPAQPATTTLGSTQLKAQPRWKCPLAHADAPRPERRTTRARGHSLLQPWG